MGVNFHTAPPFHSVNLIRRYLVDSSSPFVCLSYFRVSGSFLSTTKYVSGKGFYFALPSALLYRDGVAQFLSRFPE
jgi:hypothetical protein